MLIEYPFDGTLNFWESGGRKVDAIRTARAGNPLEGRVGGTKSNQIKVPVFPKVRSNSRDGDTFGLIGPKFSPTNLE